MKDESKTNAAILLREDAGGIVTLTLNTPAKLNALTFELIGALDTEFDRLMQDETARVIILKAAGKAFCAGHDLRELTDSRHADDGGRAELKALFDACAEMMLKIHRLPQPVIAAVQGIATAAGCQLVATCDMAVATDTARFGVNGVNIGLFCSTPMVALTRVIPRKRAFEMLTTGAFVSAGDAQAMGLVNRVVAEGDLNAETLQLADQVAGKLGAAVRTGKVAFYEQMRMSLPEAYAYTGDVIVQNMMREDTTEGVRAFLEKRPPEWE